MCFYVHHHENVAFQIMLIRCQHIVVIKCFIFFFVFHILTCIRMNVCKYTFILFLSIMLSRVVNGNPPIRVLNGIQESICIDRCW